MFVDKDGKKLEKKPNPEDYVEIEEGSRKTVTYAVEVLDNNLNRLAVEQFGSDYPNDVQIMWSIRKHCGAYAKVVKLHVVEFDF